jgi:23S rRNA (pseudouridine1915-N3)-methyltransferase
MQGKKIVTLFINCRDDHLWHLQNRHAINPPSWTKSRLYASYQFMFTILSISDSDKHRTSIVQEYTKRLGKSVKILDLKPNRNGNVQQIISADTENVITHLQKFSDTKKILLSKEWKQLDTLALHKLLTNQNAVFIIGGPYGLDEASLSKYIDMKISFWMITLPHWLAKTTLLEQLYRISTIEQWKSYHY